MGSPQSRTTRARRLPTASAALLFAVSIAAAFDAAAGPHASAARAVPPTPSAKTAPAPVAAREARMNAARTAGSVTPAPPSMLPVPFASFCATSGKVTPASRFHVDEGGMRGVVGGNASESAELHFTYGGPSQKTVPLANGEIRRQIGLKLHAQDTCNVIYVMWHVEPAPGVFVSVKRNPGMSKHVECLDNGYINLKAQGGTQPAAPAAGQPHVLSARLDGLALTVKADGVVAWSGTLPGVAQEISGPAGIRTDNAVFDFDLRVPGGAPPVASCSGPSAWPD